MQWKLSTYYLERNSNFLLLRNYLSLMYSFGPRPITSPVYGIISWCTMCRLLLTSESANFLLEIQASCTSMSITLTFGMCTQNLELRGMEPAIKFCNWIRRSSWEYRYLICQHCIANEFWSALGVLNEYGKLVLQKNRPFKSQSEFRLKEMKSRLLFM